MKQVLIISYFFPPCNLTAANRIQGWANYLSESGYYPTIVTRNWDIPISSSEDLLRKSGTEIKHEKFDNYEVYYLPYKPSLKDRWFTRWKGSPIQKLSKLFTVFELFFENWTTKAIPHRNLLSFSKEWLTNHPDVNKVIISGNPFNQFSFGYRLKQTHNINWVADYRDDWNTSEVVQIPTQGIAGFIAKLHAKSEKKWVKTARFITSVSPHYVQKISDFVDREGHTVLNGYAKLEDSTLTSKQVSDVFTITYNGSLYSTQPIEPFLNAIQRLIDEGNPIQLNFPGTGFAPVQAERIQSLTKGFSQHVRLTNRIPRAEVVALQQQSDALLMISHSNLKGIPSSKLYEYISLQKPVILYPNDQDIIESTLKDVELGVICDSENDIYTQIKQLIEQKKNSSTKELLSGNLQRIQSYSRQSQTKVLAKILDSLS